MFKTISWQEYLYVIGLIAVGYYTVIGAIFYSRDILLRLKGANVPKVKPPTSSQPLPKEKFMGAISDSPRKKIPIKQSVLDSEALSIEVDSEKMLAAQRADSPASELYERLEDFFKAMKFEKVKTPKLNGVRTYFKQYPNFVDSPVRQEVTSFVYDHLNKNTEGKFTWEEIDILWLDEKQEIIHQSTTKNNYEK
jgi:hypothetical protein